MAYPQPPFVRLCRAVVGSFVKFLMITLCEVKVQGLDNVPPYGPYFIVFNHIDTLDAPLLLLFWPYPPEGLTAIENLSKPAVGLLTRMYGAIPLKRTQYDRGALETGLAVLKAGSPLVVAPEGTRRRQAGMQSAKHGITFLALKAKAPIVPVGITGTQNWIPAWKRLHRPRLTLVIGRPFELPAESFTRENRREKLEEYTTLIMRKIAELLPDEYRGVYA